VKPASSDPRRDLYEFCGYSVCKLIVAKDNCLLGRHYHKKKKEIFVLLSGQCVATFDGESFLMAPLSQYVVPEGMPHTFCLSAGAMMLGFASAQYDPTDDYSA
jgi:mannose-6-phosphate isomerase-like protein (cupin superfamily)